MQTTDKPTTKKKPTTSVMARLLAEGNKNAQMITGAKDLSTVSSKDETKTDVIPSPEKIITNQENDKLSEKIETVSVEQTSEIVEEIKQPLLQKNTMHGIEVFTKARKNDDKLVTALIPNTQRNELKLVGTALGISMQDLIANIFDNFFEENQVEIKKAKKKLLG